jgi:Protein of unknown function (DUF3305)
VESRPSLTVAVVFERRKSPSQWEEWGFRVVDVVIDNGQFGAQSRLLRDDGSAALIVHPGISLALFRDEAEGYYLNLTSGQPVWFVMWRIDENDASRAWPEIVTLSYNEAARALDAQERVDNVPLDHEVRELLQLFTDENYKPEPKKRRRPASFLAPDKR